MHTSILQDILTPPAEFTPIPFWFFNDTPDLSKIRKQLEDYSAKGVNGIILHPRIGIPKEIPYLSRRYFAVVRFIVKTAAELNMKVVLYDEGMYPSGSAHGMVVEASPDYASKGIKIVPAGQKAEGEVVTRFADGSSLVYCFTGGTIRGIHFGEDDREPDAPKSADILNPDAVDLFIHLTHDRYYSELKEYFGNTVIAFFTDEPSALGRWAIGFHEWLPGLEREIMELGGDLHELIALFTGEKNKTTEIYQKLIKKHLREIFYRRLSVWCETHGISLMGHPENSDDVEEQLFFHVPGQDLIMRRVAPERGGLLEFDSVQAKLSADIARHLGRRRNANECFGVCYRDKIPWYFPAGDMKWYIDWLGIRGVNLYIPHAFYYSVEGERKNERPPDVGPNNIWWPHYRKFSDYMKRLSYLMTDSVNGAKVAVLCDNNRVPYKELALLFENQVEFNYLPISLLSECEVEGGKLYIQGYAYEAVLNVTDPKWDTLVKTKLYHSAEELLADPIYKVLHTKTPNKSLRVSKLQKNGTEMYLLSNEGNQVLCTELMLEAEAVTCVDLWRGEAKRKVSNKEGLFEVMLQSRETMLLIMEDAGDVSEEKESRFLGDFTDRFELIRKEENQAEYMMLLDAHTIDGTEVFEVCANEMVECYCNGELADVALWSPYRIRLGQHLKEGQNQLKLIVTGSAANIYSNTKIPFGLGVSLL